MNLKYTANLQMLNLSNKNKRGIILETSFFSIAQVIKIYIFVTFYCKPLYYFI